jgi:predicted nucleic acid-binding protein
MNVVDSSGWIEFFTNGSNAGLFATPIRDTDHLIVPSICLYEVFKRVLLGLDEDEALQTIGQMSLGEIVDLDRNIAINAARISLEFKLAMADSIILATARANDATLWTLDEHFKGLEDVKYFGKK